MTGMLGYPVEWRRSIKVYSLFYFLLYSLIFFIDLPAGKKLSMSEFNEKYGDKYRRLTDEEKAKFGQRLQAIRDEKALKEHTIVHKVSTAATADIRTSMLTVAESTYNLHNRARYAIL